MIEIFKIHIFEIAYDIQFSPLIVIARKYLVLQDVFETNFPKRKIENFKILKAYILKDNISLFLRFLK